MIIDDISNGAYYLAYGSNTNIDQMKRRCPSASLICTYTLPNFSLRFCYHADVVQDFGKSVKCVVWYLTEKDIAELDLYEGVPQYYVKRYVSINLPDIGRCKALLYQMAPERNKELCEPSKAYANGIAYGYKDNNIPLSQMTNAPGFKIDQDDADDDAEILNEIDMSPGNLRSKAATINATGGMEFEMLVPSSQGIINLALIATGFSSAIGRRVNYSDR